MFYVCVQKKTALLVFFLILFPFLSKSETKSWGLKQLEKRTVLTKPNGSPIFLLGLNHIGDSSPRDESRKQYFLDALKRVKAMGYNNLGYGTPSLLHQHFPFISSSQFLSSTQWHTHFLFKYQDVFSEAFKKELKSKVERICKLTADNPNLIGHYWSDTPRWNINITRNRRGKDWVSAIRHLPADAAGKKRYIQFLKVKYKGNVEDFKKNYGHPISKFEDLLHFDFREFDRSNPEGLKDDEEFLGIIAHELYSDSAAYFKEFSPEKLIFGERYKLYDYSDAVLKEAAKYVDVISIQPGPKNGPLPGEGAEEVHLDVKELKRIHKLTNKPILICDHHISFKTKEHPVTLWHQVESQEKALELTEKFVTDLIKLPFVIGYQKCQYRDKFSQNRGNMLKQGFIKKNGEPYQATLDGLTNINTKAKELWEESVK